MEYKNLKTKRMRSFLLVCIISLLFTSFEIKAQKGKLLTIISTELPISCIKLSPNKNVIAVADDTEDPFGFQELKETHKINILNSDNYSKKFELTGHNESIQSINFSTDSKKIVSSDKSGVIIIWNLSDGKQLAKIETNEWVHNIKFSNSGNEIIAIQGYEKVALIYGTKGNLITKLEVRKEISDFEFNPTTNEIYFGCFDEFQVWSLITREKLNSLPFSGLMCIQFNHDYSQLAIGNLSGDIIIMTPELKEIYRLKGHFKPVLSISFSFDNSKLASASSDQTSRIWDLKKQSEIVQLTNAHKGMVNGIEFISPKNVFMTGGENKELKVWK
jgi:WD40 repeat protein